MDSPTSKSIDEYTWGWGNAKGSKDEDDPPAKKGKKGKKDRKKDKEVDELKELEALIQEATRETENTEPVSPLITPPKLDPEPALVLPVEDRSLEWVEDTYTLPSVQVDLKDPGLSLHVPQTVVELCPALASQMILPPWSNGRLHFLSFPDSSKTAICLMFHFLQTNAYTELSGEKFKSPDDRFKTHAEVYQLATTYKIPALAQLAADAMQTCEPENLQDFLPTAANITSQFPTEAAWLEDLICKKVEAGLEAPEGSVTQSNLEDLLRAGGELALKIHKITRAFDQKQARVTIAEVTPAQSYIDGTVHDGPKSDAESEIIIVENPSPVDVSEADQTNGTCPHRLDHLKNLSRGLLDAEACARCSIEFDSAMLFCNNLIRQNDFRHLVAQVPKSTTISKAKNTSTYKSAVNALLATTTLLHPRSEHHPCFNTRPSTWNTCHACVNIRGQLATALTSTTKYRELAAAIIRSQPKREDVFHE